MEAMAAGKPVVVSNADGLRELVTEGADGLLTPPGDPRELAEAILRLTQDAKLRQRLGTSACQTAMERFGAESGVQALETAYDGWLGEQKGAVGANEF
jgi:glycosyltransferase involved in cell wall biosynthesis